jgi:hypothetical protein
LPGMGIKDPTMPEEVSPISSSIGVIEVNTHDNPYLNQEALNEFEATLTDTERKIRIEGKFTSLTGLIYPEFSDKNIIKPSEVNLRDSNANIIVSMDHGLRNPSAWLWHSIKPDGSVVTFWELYEKEKTIEEIVTMVLEVNKLLKIDPLYYIGDPAIKARSAITGTSVQEEFAKRGIGIALGSNDVAAGIERVKSAISNGWQVTSNCRNLVWELRKYVWSNYSSLKTRSKYNEPDVPQKKDDHLVDALRYFFANRPELLAKPVQKLLPVEKLPTGPIEIDWVKVRKKRDKWRVNEKAADSYLGVY